MDKSGKARGGKAATTQGGSRASKSRPADCIVVSSRIRLARNLEGENFPNWASEAALISVFERVCEAVKGLRAFKGCQSLNMDALGQERKEFLVECRMISSDLARMQKSGVIINKDNNASVMINEEDHLRIQVIAKGQKLSSVWRSISAIDSALEEKLPFAFSEKFGYLTACPTNIGTGMRASLMMHLPALWLSGDMEKIVRGVNQIGMTVRGENGEGSEAVGSFYQISNQQTLGVTEEETIAKLLRICKRLKAIELNARALMLQKRPMFLADKIARAWATLTHCRMIDTAESIGCISFLRLACDLGMYENSELIVPQLDELILQIKPAHLELETFVDPSDIPARDAARAEFIKNALNKIGAPNVDKALNSVKKSTIKQS